MTRQEAIDYIALNQFGLFDGLYGRWALDAIEREEWGVAANLIFSAANDNLELSLADALWEGKK